MFAVIKTGGKQYKVASGDIIEVERLIGSAGDKITLGDVLALGGDKTAKIGTPFVKGASVTAEILAETRGDKVIIFKKKRRQNYRRKNGHRQTFTQLKITGIKSSSAKSKDEAAEA